MEAYWNRPAARTYPALTGRRRADAAVIGGGLAGAHIALWLCRAGLKVTLLEAETLGAGASARCAGIASVACGVRYARVEHVFGAEAAFACAGAEAAALRSLRELAGEPGMASRWRDMDLSLVTDGRRAGKALEAEAAAMRRAGMEARVTDAAQCPLPADRAIVLRDQATLHPMAHLCSVVERARALGLTVYERSRVVRLESGRASTARGSVNAPYIVVATGFPILNAPGWYFPRLTQRRSALIPLDGAEAFGGMYRELDGRYALRQTERGALLWRAGERAGDRQAFTPPERFRAELKSAFPGVRAGRYDAGYEVYSADGLPFIGPYSERTPDILVASGFGGGGLLGGVIAAQAISARVLGLTEAGYGLFSGNRPTPRSLAAYSACALGQLGRYAAGFTRRGAPRCTHMGCRLVYDRRARLWVCPCHGSRFDDIGRVIAAPAVDDAALRGPGNGV